MNERPSDLSMEHLQVLVLARLCTRAKKPPARSAVTRSVGRFLQHAFSPAEQRSLIGAAVDELVERAEVQATPLALTERGKARVQRALGADERDLDWRVLRKHHLIARSLGLAPSRELDKRVGDVGGLRAVVLWQRRALPLTRPPTLTQAVDALVWRALGVETDAPLTLDKLRVHVLHGLVDARRESRLLPERAKLESILAARAAGSQRTDVESLRAGLLAGWLTEPTQAAARRPAEEPATIPAAKPAAEPDLVELARAVNQVAATVTGDGRFGERKVFISAIWQRMAHMPVCAGVSVEHFKELLVRANREDLLWLHRADLVPLMPEHHVLASEIRHGNATFHFIEIQPAEKTP